MLKNTNKKQQKTKNKIKQKQRKKKKKSLSYLFGFKFLIWRNYKGCTKLCMYSLFLKLNAELKLLVLKENILESGRTLNTKIV